MQFFPEIENEGDVLFIFLAADCQGKLYVLVDLYRFHVEKFEIVLLELYYLRVFSNLIRLGIAIPDVALFANAVVSNRVAFGVGGTGINEIAGGVDGGGKGKCSGQEQVCDNMHD